MFHPVHLQFHFRSKISVFGTGLKLPNRGICILEKKRCTSIVARVPWESFNGTFPLPAI